MTFRCRLAALALAGAGTSLAAVDLVERTAYVRLEALPRDFTYEVQSPNGTLTGDDSYGQHLALALGGRYSFAAAGSRQGALVGLELAVAQATIDPDGGRLGVEGRVLGGWGVALTRQWTVLGTVRASWMLDDIDLVASEDTAAYQARGSGWAVQPEVTVAWSPGGRWRIGLDVGWRVARNTYHGDDLDIDLEESGFVASIGFEYILSAAPRSLE